MSWEKIEDHLFYRYSVEGEDNKLGELENEHDKEIRNQTIDDFLMQLKKEYSVLKNEMPNEYLKVCNRFDIIAEQLKERT